MASNENIIELSKVIKRLELIKSLIALEEEQEIATHISRLRQFSLNGELEMIINNLEARSYSKAMPAIEAFINQYRQLIIYSDPEIEGLKLEAKTLEAELNILSNEKADLEKLIYEFGVRHNQELGELIIKILQLKKEKAKGTLQETEAEQNFEEYTREYELTKDEIIFELTEEEEKELKQKYRRASKLCHPDVVNENQKELADNLFSELNAAYERNDLKRVREILESFEKGDFFVSKSDSVNEKQVMKVEIEKLRSRIKDLKAEVQAIKGNEVYKTVINIVDWDKYFSNIKQQLLEQIEAMVHGK